MPLIIIVLLRYAFIRLHAIYYFMLLRLIYRLRHYSSSAICYHAS